MGHYKATAINHLDHQNYEHKFEYLERIYDQRVG